VIKRPPPAKADSLLIKEIFPTIQGEGPLAGTPAVFVRLAGCNLACWFCDTDFSGGTEVKVTHLLREITELGGEIGAIDSTQRPLAVLTGGEPMMQPIGVLARSLLGEGWRVQIETDGVLWTELPDSEHLTIVCSPKTPKIHPRLRGRVDAWKYLIREADPYDPVDGLPISNTQDHAKPLAALAKPTRGTTVYLQPVDEDQAVTNYRNTDAAISRAMRYGHTLCLQQHKILGLR
jgi:7-carboxy-7-deazaguanine synthase